VIKIKFLIKILGAVLILTLIHGNGIVLAEEKPMERIPHNHEEHNWKQSSVDYHTIEVGEHEFSYWKNFMKHSRTCHISHRIKTVVYYCDIHGHTKSETILDEIIHSVKHDHD
jgi:hypothetical protein